ncbi:MAG: hypothetical protein AABY73_05035 [Pseudomonadota bacterium]
MTALVFALQPDQICIAMDTLVVGAEDKRPMSFQRKFLSLAENNLLIAGTGLANLINGWFTYISSLSDLSDIDDLYLFAPNVLQASVAAAGGLGEITTTLYHFGYSKIEARYVGYAYRSTANFQSERLQYALGFKPQVRVEAPENIEFPRFMIEIILEQQRQDLLLPIDQQVGIGGEIEFAVLADGSTNIETVHRFASYESEKKYIECRENA